MPTCSTVQLLKTPALARALKMYECRASALLIFFEKHWSRFYSNVCQYKPRITSVISVEQLSSMQVK